MKPGPVHETMALQSALLRHDVNHAALSAPGREASKGENAMADQKKPDNRPMKKLRDHLLGLGGKEETIEIGGRKFLLVAPDEKKAAQIQQAALKYSLKKGPDGHPERGEDGKPTGAMDFNMDQLELKVRSMIECTFDPETRQPVFTRNDPTEVEAIYGAKVSAARRKLMEACVKLLAPDQDEVEKNSAAVPEGTSSSH